MTKNRRRPIVAGNWKMNTTLAEAGALAAELAEPLAGLGGVETVLCPPSISLAAVLRALDGRPVGLGAQNCHFEPKGAYTGEVSPTMLADLGCSHVILGHSERRAQFGETDGLIASKLRAAQAHGLIPIVCVGENLEQREGGKTHDVVAQQVRGALAHLSDEELSRLVVAYEPVWAIGTGRAASAAQANETIGFIRGQVIELAGWDAGGALRIQYGGSVTPSTAAELFAQPEIDGALVGGASLKAPDFIAICRAAHES